MNERTGGKKERDPLNEGLFISYIPYPAHKTIEIIIKNI